MCDEGNPARLSLTPPTVWRRGRHLVKEKELLEAIAKALVDRPEEVAVHVVEGEEVTVLELRVHTSDIGKVIGKQGRMARSIRTILSAAGMKNKRRVIMEILE